MNNTNLFQIRDHSFCSFSESRTVQGMDEEHEISLSFSAATEPPRHRRPQIAGGKRVVR